MISNFKFNMVNIEGGNCAKKFHINKNKKKNENQTTAGRNNRKANNLCILI